jgi:O-antigen/teichoic acid export membrane protein
LSASSVSVSPPAQRSGYASGARILSVGIATTGIVTFAYFALAAHALTPAQYTHISLLWSIMFVIVSVIYRPIEQLLSRTIAERRARGQSAGGTHLRVALLIQGAFALMFLAVALALREPLQQDVFDGSAALYRILVFGVLAYAASYFGRGFLAGHQRFALYGALVFLEATSRVCFALAVIDGLASGHSAGALGMAAAPLQLFQAVQGSLLPHLAGLQATAGNAEFRHAIRVTVLASGGFGLAVGLGLFAIGPVLVGAVFDIERDLARGGLALVGFGMGLHLVAGTLNQAALAREQAPAAAAAWLLTAALFVAFLLSPLVDDQLLRAETGYFGGTALLCVLLAGVYRRRPAGS